MNEELVFYTNPMSRGRIIRWMLEEVGAPYRTEILDYATTMKAPAYRAINPMAKVPAIRHGETVVTECAAICAYLADAFPHAALAPLASSRLRGPYYRWLFFASGPLEAAAVNQALGVVTPPERARMAGYGSGLPEVVGVIEAAIKGRNHLVGDTFTAADLYLGAQLGWLMQFGVVEKRLELARYVGGLQARPAAKRAREIDDALIPPQA
jgi:glutathione S-transferase